MNPSVGIRVSHFTWGLILGIYAPLLATHAQESDQRSAADADSIDEIVVIVDRDGKRVDVDALRLQEARLKVIREFRIEQHKQEEEVWRQKLRYALQRRSSRIAWGYDAQTEAARFRYSQANYLPLDRVRPATMISIRF